MTPKIITYFLCGMRHPTTGLSEDDLSRLTGSSSSTTSSGNNSNISSSSSSSSSSSPSGANSHDHRESGNSKTLSKSPDHTTATKHNNNKNSQSHITTTTTATSTKTRSTYLPEFINPLEWQKSRKRKERLDSTSSVTQDRKLQRSNSEELLPQEAQSANKANKKDGNKVTGSSSGSGSALKASNKTADVIRRVSSEDFKKTNSSYEQELHNGADDDHKKINSTDRDNENDSSLANRYQHESLSSIYRQTSVNAPTKDMTRHYRYETSPARSQRLSPVRGNGPNSSGKYRDSDDSECEHERRRSSERFSKSRAPPGRRAAGVTKKNSSSSGSKYLSSKRGEENAYKYDLSALKSERRGFTSKKPGGVAALSDHNDNNLIDFHQQKRASTPVSPTPSSCGSDITVVAAPTSASAGSSPTPSPSPSVGSLSTKPTPHRRSSTNSIPIISAQEALPWERPVPEDQTPVLSRRYATVRHHPSDNLDTAAKLSKVMPYPQPAYKQKQIAAQMLDDELDGLEPLNMFRGFSSLDEVGPRDLMEQIIPAMMSSQSPEERLKQINKRLTAMKKKLAQLEESYEARMGYRPSQADRLNDKSMKNILAELSKLRKERHELKTDTVFVLGQKMSGDMDPSKKLDKMKATLGEIEQNLTEQREDGNRSDNLEELTADQLVQEKTAVQHRLLYFESLFGRPCTKDERDAARPLYDRYRQLKRMVSRSVLISSTIGAPELPTILEHEAMVFEFTPQQYSSNNSTETSNSPISTEAPNLATTSASDESTTTTTGTPPNHAAMTAAAVAATVSGAAAPIPPATDANENISDLSIDQLWEQLEKVRGEKKMLKATIREYEAVFEEQNGRKMLKSDRRTIEETYATYKEKKAKSRLLQALIKKHNNSR